MVFEGGGNLFFLGILNLFFALCPVHKPKKCYNTSGPALEDSGSNNFSREDNSTLIFGLKLSSPTWIKPGVGKGRTIKTNFKT